MIPIVLSKDHEWARKESTVLIRAGVATKIIEFEAPRKLAFYIAAGALLRLKLRNASSVELPASAKLCFAGKDRRDMLANQISPAVDYRSWADVAENDMYNEKYFSSLAFPFGRSGQNSLLCEELEKVSLFVDVSEDFTVDWSKSKLEVAATEYRMDELSQHGLLGADFSVR